MVGIRKSEGTFVDDSGKSINYSAVVVSCLRPQPEGADAIGLAPTDYKIKGAENYILYKNLSLPLEMDLVFAVDFSSRIPKTILQGLEKTLDN